MMFRKSVMVAVSTLVVLVGITSHTLAKVDTMTEPTLLTEEQYQQVLNEAQRIGSEFGEFERTSEPVIAKESEITYNIYKISAETRYIVLDYGVFKKK